MQLHTPDKKRNLLGSREWLIVLFVVGLLGLYLVTAHLNHLLAALPYLFLAACPLMHVFMHRGHGGQDHGDSK